MTSFKDRTDYIRTLFAPETEELRRARESLPDNIGIHPEEGKLLQFLIRLIDAKKIVEIGTFCGYSTLWMAATGAHVHTIEKDPGRAKIARQNLAAHANVTLTEGDALDILPTLEGPFDMVFIDADKISYLHYLDWAEKNVRKGGLVVGDNTFLFDAVWQETMPDRVRKTALDAMRAFNTRLADPARYCSIMLPTAEGMTIGLKLFD